MSSSRIPSRRIALWVLILCVVYAGPAVGQDESASTDASAEAAPPPPPPDRVVLKDGTVIVGTIQTMAKGELEIESTSAGTVKAKWEDVESIEMKSSHALKLTDGSQIKGKLITDANGAHQFTPDIGTGTTTIDLAEIGGINPKREPPVKFRGNASAGLTIIDGNTQSKSASLNGDFEARSERQRLTFGAAYNYASDSNGLIARNARGRMKYDFFMTKRWFLFLAAFVENDYFQDLNLRTSLGGGIGYQFIEAGDFESDWFKDLEAYGEIGLTYFDEDFRRGIDNSYVSALWHAEATWPFFDRFAAFHRHWVYPGLEDLKDVYVLTESGLRFTIWEGFIATLQVDYRWDSTPSAGQERDDTTYLATLGYSFKF